MRYLTASPLLRNILAVASGAAAGQVVVFTFSPLITRIYSPHTFGLQGIFLSLVSILSPVIALRYPMAIVVASDEAEVAHLSRLAVLIAFGLSMLLGLVLLFAKEPVLYLLGAESLGTLIWFLPLALFCVSLQDVANFRVARRGAFRLVGIVSVTQAFLTNLARVLGGLAAPVAGVLVAITSIAPAVQASLLSVGSRSHRQSSAPFSRREALSLLRQHRDFPLFRTPTDVLDAISQSVPVILLAALYSPAAAGLYALARSVVSLPLNIIGSAVGNVYYTRFAEMARMHKPLLPLVLPATLMHFLLLGVSILLIAPLFPSIFAGVFGEMWRESGEYACWMSLWISGMLTNIPSVRVLPVIGRQEMHLVSNATIMAGGILALYASYAQAGSAETAVLWYSVVVSILYIAQIVGYLSLTARYDRRNRA